MPAKYVLNYESGDYELIDENGFSLDQGEIVFFYDDSEFDEEDDEW